MRVWGVSIGEEQAVLVQRTAGNIGVESVEVLPLATHLSREKAISEFFKTVQEKDLFAVDDHIHLSLFSYSQVSFVTELDRSITEVEQTLSWELGQRIEGNVTKYAFSYAKINNHRYLVSGMLKKELDSIVKRFSRLGVEVVTVDVESVAALQTLELNGMVGQSFFYVHCGVSQVALLVVNEGSLKSMRYAIVTSLIESVKHLLADAREDYPDITHFLVGGEALNNQEAVDQLLRETEHGSSVNPFHVIPYTGELAVDQIHSLITSAVGLSQKAV